MVKIRGGKGVQQRLAKLASREKVKLVGRALFVGGDTIKAEAAHLITQNAVSGKKHVPSKAGQAPNEDTGALRSGLRVTQPAPLRVRVEATAPHSAPLEFGTSKMAARPFMNPAAKRKRKEVVALVGRAVKSAIKKG